MISSAVQILAKCLCVWCHAVGPSPALPDLAVLNETEIVPSNLRTKSEALPTRVADFFNPVTCRPRANQAVAPCQAGGHINTTLCLKHKCCVSSRKHVQLDCYTPVEDRPLQILRFCGVGIGGMVIIACLPFCCFIVERSPCANPLLRSPKEEESEEESEGSSGNTDGGGSTESGEGESVDLLSEDVEKHQTKKKKRI